MNGSLHSLRCTNDPCSCEPLYVRVSTSRAREKAYTVEVAERDSAQAAESNYNHAGPAVPAIPGASGSLRVIGDRR